MKKNLVSIFRTIDSLFGKDRENWFKDRLECFEFCTEKNGEAAAEEAFVITNAPDEYLNDEQMKIKEKNNFKGPSLSVGDVVRVSSIIDRELPEYYLCMSFGWEKFDGNRIQLLKHLTW